MLGIIEHTHCRVCGGSFEPLLDLGTPVLPAYLKPDEPDPERAPLDLVVCSRCELVQLRHSVDSDRLYRQYWYQSGINETMVAELRDVAANALAVVGPLNYQDTLLDVGANDGTLLRLFAEQSEGKLFRIAVDPAYTFANRLHDHAEMVVADYFPNQDTNRLPDHSVKILTSIAMFYDLDDPMSFVQEVDRLLTPDGVWIVQMQDLAQMVKATAYDNVCFEHRAYYSTRTFNQLLEGTDLWITKIESRAINGGSLRYTLQRGGHHWNERESVALVQQLAAEAWITRDRLNQFAESVEYHKDSLAWLVAEYNRLGKSVDLYAASTKSSTLLQYCGIDHRLIRCAVERSPEKVGLVTSGTRIPIISEEQWRRDPAPVTLLSAWGFRDAVIQREVAYVRQGGTLIVPLPVVEIIQHETQQLTA